jgi:hypothetical protein
MKFEIEDYTLTESMLFVVVLKDGLFSKDINIIRSEFEEWLVHKVLKRYIHFGIYWKSNYVTTDIYNYIKEHDLVKDIIEF